MAVRVEVEEIHTTKSEKLLALVLAVFLLIGGIWSYVRIDDAVRAAVEIPNASAADQAALDRAGAAQELVFAAEQREAETLAQLTLAREAYRTALDAGNPAPELEQRYEQAQASHAEAERDLLAAREELAAAEGPATAAGARVAEEQEQAYDRQAMLSFAFRLLLVSATIALGYVLLSTLRRRGSRYLPLALAWVGFAALLALVMAGDYVTDYVDPLDLGPLVLALVGIAFTVAAFVALQRYLARRIPIRRVRKGECPFCGYPARGTPHCEGCGRDILAACTSCASPRRVGSLYCGACGNAAG
jgi:uncharacterized protein YfiM (DUF2279 family)